MKVCPFCREEIRDDAIKCRHCSSFLLPAAGVGQGAAESPARGAVQLIYVPDKNALLLAKILAITLTLFVAIGLLLWGYEIRQAGQLSARSGSPGAVVVPAPAPNQTVYVLDQGLVRFAKFTGGILAVFVTVGLFLYGVDIKQVAKDVRAEADRIRQIKDDANKLLQDSQASISQLDRQAELALSTQTKIEAGLKQIENVQQQVEAKLEEIVKNAARVEETATAAQTFYLGMKTQAETAQLQAPDQPKPTKTEPAASTRKNGLTVPELARLYNFPTELDGSGQCIGLIELGGGYRKSDLKTYFDRLGLPNPKVTPISIGGAKNSPSSIDGVNTVVTMNIEVAGAVAPGAHIAVYFAPNSEQGFIDAISAAVADETNAPSVLVITWGNSEKNWTQEAITAMDQGFQAAAKKQITVLCSSGDNGPRTGGINGHARIVFPASSPWVLACGGTRLTTSKGKIISEVPWDDKKWGGTGWGVSEVFPLPDWQSEVNVPASADGHRGRAIPDLSGNASPSRGYKILEHGKEIVVGGTSSTAPFLAGLIALMNQSLGRNLGHINPLLYQKIGPAGVIQSITEGDNTVDSVKGYAAAPGWNATTGWGRPDGRKLLEAFRAHS
jgi:kumamolisin